MKPRELQALAGWLVLAVSVGWAAASIAIGAAVFGAGLVVSTVPGWFDRKGAGP